MELLKDYKPTWLESLTINILKNGPIPKHIAFIMDGNRRHAAKMGLHKSEGHRAGIEKVTEVLKWVWCYDLGITEVTIYVFSIENLKRTKEEVDLLLNQTIKRFKKFLDDKECLNEKGVCVRFWGDLTLLSVDSQKLLAEIELYTKDNSKFFFTVCVMYTSRNEMTNAVKDLAESVVQGSLELEDINEELLEHCLYSATATFPDVVVRTSGEVHLSDFLLWQSRFSLLEFSKVLWPEFNIWHLFAAILHYQHNHKTLTEIERIGRKDRRCELASSSESQHEVLLIKDRQNRFIVNLYKKRLRKLEDMKAGKTTQRLLLPREINY